jgi:poly-beta-1,6-N-acetyl-D-glucosamine synthase
MVSYINNAFYHYDMGAIFFILWICTAIILGYWFWFYLSFKRFNGQKVNTSDEKPGVSVIVCYKDAGVHIYHTIAAILKQEYNDFEVIAIDDFSHDDGPYSLKSIEDHRLVLMTANLNRPGKKAALSEAISEAKNDILLFTDADCVPVSGEWISSMVKKMIANEGVEIVLGYGPMNKKDGWLNRFSRFETIMTAMQYFSYAVTGMTYMGVGRNLMYRKSLFERIEGFEKHLDLPSGDDDLLIAQGSNPHNVSICLDPVSFVYSDAKLTPMEFLYQKSRHITTSTRYNFTHKSLLGLFAISHVGFYTMLILAISFDWASWPILLSVILLKWSLQIVLQKRIFATLDGGDLHVWFPVLDILWVIYYMVLPVFSAIRKRGW